MDNKNQKEPQNRRAWFYVLITALILFSFFSYLSNQIEENKRQAITYTQFHKMIENGEIKSVLIKSDTIEIEPINQPNDLYKVIYYTGRMEGDPTLVSKLNEYDVETDRERTDARSAIVQVLLAWVLPFVLIYVVMWFFFKMVSKSGGGMMGGVGKSNAKVYVEKETGVTFKDVAGQEEAKESLTEIVDFLHNPGKYTRIGAKLPKGALLVGPPGTGKTLLAKAIAGEAKVPFFSLSGSDFVEMFVGVGASRVRDLFKQAQQMAPCIIFIDEVDAIGKSRDSQYGGGNDEREQTLNQLLSEMDGFDSSKGLVILAATNRPEVLDKALLRPGRFDRRVIVDKPDLKGRVDILKVHSKDVLMHDSINLEEIALATSGAVGSDLANMINEAAILAVKQGRTVVTQEEEKCLMSKDEMLTRIVTLYGGRAAEKLVFDSVNTGASNAIEKATQLARAMVTQYGMSDKFGLIGLESIQNRYLDGRAVLNCGDATAAEIDTEVMNILKKCYDKAESLLAGNREALDKIAEFLIEKETITGKEFMEIYNKINNPAEEGNQEDLDTKTEETGYYTEYQPGIITDHEPKTSKPSNSNETEEEKADIEKIDFI